MTDEDRYAMNNLRIFKTREHAELYQKIQQAKLRIEKWLVLNNNYKTQEYTIYFDPFKKLLEYQYIDEDLETQVGAYTLSDYHTAEKFIKEMHDDIMLVIGK